MKIDLIAGARPNFMKIAPIIHAIEAGAKDKIHYRLIHTGQHYDKNMSDQFFEQLGIPDPQVNLGAGGGTQAEQTAKIMTGYEQLLLTAPSDLCLVVGDVTSTMACSIVAKKQGMKVAHVEAGIRSGDWKMPEEINRVVTDSITDYFFTTSAVANENLRKSGVREEQIFFVGNTMIDTLLRQRPHFRKPAFWDEHQLNSGDYFVVTLHRPSNVDDPKQLEGVLRGITGNTKGKKIIFPVHPRTRQKLASIQWDASNVILVDPLGYLEFNYIVEHSKAVITDSGGITEETTVMGIPCMTLRDSTERPETVTEGTNELLGSDPSALRPALERLFNNQWKRGRIPALWDGKTAERIVAHLLKLAE